MKYFSQFGQDFFIDKYLNNKNNGFFVDIGAYDGISCSNTYFFEKYRNWNGICIEPIPEVFEKLKNNRNCHLINGAISHIKKELKFRRCYGTTEMLSGLIDYLEEEHDFRTKEAIKINGSKYKIITVNGYVLSSILDELNITKIDYLSLDIEGGEFEVLETIDFKKYYIKMLTVENNYNSNRVKNLLIKNNYKFLFHKGVDDFYIKNS